MVNGWDGDLGGSKFESRCEQKKSFTYQNNYNDNNNNNNIIIIVISINQ